MAVWIFMEATTGTDPEIPPDPAEDLLRRKSQGAGDAAEHLPHLHTP
jgi:hypothetical protein